MPDTYSIIVTGLNTEEESFVSTHFSQSGHEVIPVKSLIKARETLSNKNIDLMYVNASKDDGIADKLKEIFNSKPSLPVVIVCDKATDEFYPQRLALRGCRHPYASSYAAGTE